MKQVQMKTAKQHCHVKHFFHCGRCLSAMPPNTAPVDFARVQIGFTDWGIQIWCLRCNRSVAHFDFLGQRFTQISDHLPANAKVEPLSENALDQLCLYTNPRIGDRLAWTRRQADHPRDTPLTPSPDDPDAQPGAVPSDGGQGVAPGIAGVEAEGPGEAPSAS